MHVIRNALLILACAATSRAHDPATAKPVQLLVLRPDTGDVVWRHAAEDMRAVYAEFFPEGALVRRYRLDKARKIPPLFLDCKTGEAVPPFRTERERRVGRMPAHSDGYRAGERIKVGENWTLWCYDRENRRLVFAPPDAKRIRRTGLPKEVPWSVPVSSMPADLHVDAEQLYFRVGPHLTAYRIGAKDPAWSREFTKVKPGVTLDSFWFQLIDGRIFVQASTRILEVDRGNGLTIWEKDLPVALDLPAKEVFDTNCSPVEFALADNSMLIAAARRRIAAFSLPDWEVLWSFDPQCLHDGAAPFVHQGLLYLQVGLHVKR